MIKHEVSPLHNLLRRLAALASALGRPVRRLLFAGLLLLPIIFLTYLGLDMAEGTPLATLPQKRCPRQAPTPAASPGARWG